MDALDQKVTRIFAGKVVRKDLLHQLKGGENVPSYVLEYLLGKYCASDDEQEIKLGIEAVKDTLTRNYFRHDEANKAQSLVEQKGKYRFIDRIDVRFLASESKYWASMDNFGFNRIHVAQEYYRRYERLLEGGIWAITDVEYHANDDGPKGSPFHIAAIKPVQLARFDFEEYAQLRSEFSTDEWIDILIRSVGLEPQTFDRRLKLLLLSRLIPFVEHNYNFIELGPRGTGKSYAYSEFSPYCILISGGKASSANLFYNNARRKVGLVGYWDVVAFDEVGGMKVSDPDVMQIMKDYAANGRFSRGVAQITAEASLVFVGNLNQPVESLVANSATDLFQPLPKEFDLALIDRLHFYLPGWEVPKNSTDILTKHYGFVTDYLAEAFRHLAKSNQTDTTEKFYRLGNHVEGRDARAVRRTVSGFVKLLHPDGKYEKEEVREYVELALEGRRRVKEQLKKRHFTEFHKTSFSYIDNETNHEVVVAVPEQSGTGSISQDPLPAGSVYAGVIDLEANVGLYRIEVNCLPGTGKLKSPASMEKTLKESLQRAFSYLQVNQDKMGLTTSIAQKDLMIEAVELTGGRVEAGCGIPFFIAMMSAIHDRPVDTSMVILGDLTIQGNIKGLSSILEPLQVAVDNGATRALVPIANKNQFAALPEEVVENLELVFYGDPDRALRRALAN
ncbi:Lon protease [Rubripirellula lacrimiformis]|uniref:Lon protease n=1 Tax=Rubripirellula lacrimiformis TaxID=1930273 RepID=A0A517N4Y9_9BACT|nr:protease Lon-related BREX system protein BrxL [Rubripirellula lacrimiformis]QDT02204.1 Lon protease [Rubripirellula lacrimiformis]